MPLAERPRRLKAAALAVSRVMTVVTVVLAAAAAIVFTIAPGQHDWLWLAGGAGSALVADAAAVWYGRR